MTEPGTVRPTWSSKFHWLVLAALMGLAVYIRIPFVREPRYYNSDTAVIDLMAKHALQGEFTFYYWGEGYYGLLDHFLLIPLVKIFGTNPSVSQTVPLALTLVFLALFHRVVERSADRWTAHAATLLLAIPSPFFVRWTFNAYQYIVVPSLGMAHFLFYEHLRERPNAKNHFLMGLLAGFSWYYYRLISVFWAAMVLSWWLPARARNDLETIKTWVKSHGFRKLWRALWDPPVAIAWQRGLFLFANVVLVINTGLAIGLWLHGDWWRMVHGTKVSLPFWPTAKFSIELALAEWMLISRKEVIAFLKGAARSAIVRSLVSGFLIGNLPAIVGSLAGHSPSSPGKVMTLLELTHNFSNLFRWVIPDMLFPDGPTALNYVAAILFLLGAGVMAALAVRQIRAALDGRPAARSLMPLLFVSSFVLTMIGSPIGDRYNSRYFMPLYLTLPMGAVWLTRSGNRIVRILTVSAVLLTAADFWMANQARAAQPYQQQYYERLRRALLESHITGGFADYWIAYWLTAASNEQLLFAPIGNNDRYKPYIKEIHSMPRIALIEETPGVADRMTVKGADYQVIERKMIEGFPVAILERI